MGSPRISAERKNWPVRVSLLSEAQREDFLYGCKNIALKPGFPSSGSATYAYGSATLMPHLNNILHVFFRTSEFSKGIEMSQCSRKHSLKRDDW